MSNIIDLTGQRFGRLTVIEKAGKTKFGNILWKCACDCGSEHIVASAKLIQGKTKSCGCLARDIHVAQLEKHGITTGGKPRTLIIWAGMKARCNNPKSISYHNYGARGIKVCEEWLSFESFHKWCMMNGYSDDKQLDRINNDGNYEPSNCRFVTRAENLLNTRRTRIITVRGISLPLKIWCAELPVSRATIYAHSTDLEEFIMNKIDTGKGQQYFINLFLNKDGENDG